MSSQGEPTESAEHSLLSSRRSLLGRTSTVLLVGTTVAAVGAIDLFANLGSATVAVDEPTYILAGREYLQGITSRNLEHPYLAKQFLGLSQRILGNNLLAARLPGAVFAAFTALVLFDLGRRLAGRWTGLLASALWLLLPQAPGTGIRLDRFAALEPPMIFFMVLATWLSVIARQRTDPRLLPLAAAAAGLAASAKLPGAVALVPVTVATLGATTSAMRRAALLVGQAGISAAFFWLPYAVQGDARLAGLRFALHFQAQHVKSGHPVLVAGHLYERAPWWASWWWEATYLGVATTLALWLLAAAGAWHHRRQIRSVGAVTPVFALLLGSVLAVALSPLGLAHYHLLWVPGLVLTAILGATALIQRGGFARGLVLLLLALMVPLAISTTAQAATLEPTDYAKVDGALRRAGLTQGTVLVWGYTDVAGYYLEPRFRVLGSAGQGRPVAVVVDPVVADRQRDSATARQVAALTPTCASPQKLDRLLLYLCPR